MISIEDLERLQDAGFAPQINPDGSITSKVLDQQKLIMQDCFYVGWIEGSSADWNGDLKIITERFESYYNQRQDMPNILEKENYLYWMV